MCLGRRKRLEAEKEAHHAGQPLAQENLSTSGLGRDHTKNAYLASQYRRVAGPRGKKRALIAIGRSRLVIFYHMMRSGRATPSWAAIFSTVSNLSV